MKPSEITAETVIRYARIEEGASDVEPELLLSAAKAFAAGYTGLDETGMDAYEDISIAILALCSDMYDNRQTTVDRANLNRTVQAILDLHVLNFV